MCEQGYAVTEDLWHSLGLSRFDDLLLEHGWSGETKGDLVGGEFMVAVSDGGDSALHDLSVEWVHVDLLVLSSVSVDSDSSSGDVGWEAL